MVAHISYNLTKGELWDRLVIVKNKRNRRVFHPSDARCTLDLGTTRRSIPVTINSDGGLYLRIDPDESLDLPTGTFDFDIAALVRDYWKIIAKGTLTVVGMDNITPIQESQHMEIRFKKGEDYRDTIAWTDSTGSLVSISTAYMQAKDSAGATAIDLRWFDSTPNEATIIALTGNQRGYLAPYPNQTLEIHISDKNTVTAGTYTFDLFVKDAVGGDWFFLTGGTIVVEPSVSVAP